MLRRILMSTLLVIGGLFAADVTIAIEDVSDNTATISMSSTVDVGGFQFTLTDNPEILSVTGASGGLAGGAGFMMSTNPGGMVLGFSMTGATIPAGDGTLVEVALNISGDASTLSLTSPVFSDASGGSLTVELGPDYNYGDVVIEDELTLSFGDYNEGAGTVDVLMANTNPVAGFQFDLTNVTITGASGGSAADNGFTVSNSSSTVIGFSISGATIPAGDAVLTTVVFSADAGSEVCFNGPIFSDSSGDAYDVTLGDCFTTTGGGGDIEGCTDETALNYNPDATVACNGDNSCCEYEVDPPDDNFALAVIDGSADAGASGSIFIDLTNSDDVGGFQFVLSDTPDILSYVEVLTTDRTEGFTVSANEGESGVTVVGFSMTGATVAPGDGAIIEVVYNAGMVEFDTDVAIEMSGTILSDPYGQSIEHSSSNGLFAVYSAPLTTPTTPENVSATGGQNSISVSWDASWQAAGYHVFQNGELVADIEGTSFTQTDLADETEYCFSVSAYNDAGESDASDSACATTFPEYTGPPVLSLGSASINAGDSFDIDVSLANPGVSVAGIQIQIADAPDHLDASDIVGTDRLEGMTVSWNPQADGSVVFVAFSMTGDVIEAGTGPIAVISYESTSIYEASIDLDIVESILSDGEGQPIEHTSEGGTVEVAGEEPPPEAPDAPINLDAEDGDSQVDLTWDASFNAETYNVYREMQPEEPDTDIGAECQGCDASSCIYDCEMQCVDAELAYSWIGDGYCDDGTWGLYLDCEEFTFDGGDCGGQGNGDSCAGNCGGYAESCYCDDVCEEYGDCCPDYWDECQGGGGGGGDCTFYDCIGQCADGYESWLGDGYCDDGTWGLYFNCEEYENDYGDCDGGGGGGGGSSNCEDCEFDFTNYGSECCDTAWDEYGISCSDLETNYSWDCSGCACPGDTEFSSVGNGISDETTSIINWESFMQGQLEKEPYVNIYDLTHDSDGNRLDAHGDLFQPKEYYEVQNRTYELIAVVTDPSYVDTDVINGMEYCYYVTAENVSGTSDPSNISCSSPYGLNAPTDLSATGEDNNIHLEWTAPEDNGGGGNDPFCGDGNCDPNENENTCPQDCESTQDCMVASPDWLGDGYCDEWANDGTPETAYNSAACGWDGGDCCYSTCNDATYSCDDSTGPCDANACFDPNGNNDDCNGNPGGDCVDCIGQDCTGYESWLGDGYCDDGTWGIYFDCEEFDWDAGDCDPNGNSCEDQGMVTCSDGSCAPTYDDCGGSSEGCEDCENDYTAYGSECCDSAWDEYGIDCATLEASYSWDCSGCLCPGDSDPVCGDGVCSGDEDYYNCPSDCNAPGECEPGYVADCDGTAECWPESWIGDGYPDCEDQQYGADLTCYDNDGGDCTGDRSLSDAARPIFSNNSSQQFTEEGRKIARDLKNLIIQQRTENSTYYKEGHNGHNIYNSSRDLTGYNVYRDGALLDFTTNTFYDDGSVNAGVEYCYTVSAEYDEGESSESNEACAVSTEPADPVYLSVGDATLMSGESGSVEVDLENANAVAGFQFELDFSGLADITNVLTTDRTEGFSISENNGIIIGFSITGDVIAPGDGAILVVEFDATDSGSGDICFDNIVLSDPAGLPMNPVTECGSILVTDEPVELVELSIGSGASEVGGTGNVDISMANVDAVGGFQFSIGIDPDIATIVDVLTTDRTEGFTVSFNNSTIIGFSITGDTVAPGEGPILTMVLQGDSAGDAEVCFGSELISDPFGESLPTTSSCGSFSVSDEPVEGCMDETACNYDPTATIDGECDYESCVGCMDEDALNYDADATIACDDCCIYVELQHFVIDIDETGTSSLVIIEDATGLDIGDEIGLYDVNGITETNEDCDGSYDGAVLVGAGVWTGEQIEIVGIGSVDMCDFNGPQLAGYVDGNDVTYKVWKASEDEEYNAEATYSAGNGVWGELITAVSLLEPVFSVTQEVSINSFMLDMVSFNVLPEDAAISSVLGGIDILTASNDQGEFYVPSFGVNQIGDINTTNGYRVFLSGNEDQTVTVEGMAVDAGSSLTISAFMMNMISYLPQECMATDQVFAGYEDDILIVKNDSGDYFVPSFGVMTLTELCPGEGYAIFLNGNTDIDFSYPDGGLARTALTEIWEDYKVQSATTHYDITPTGISHPIILDDISGEISVGDEVAAYANGVLVGATKVVDQDLVVLSAWGGYHDADLGINLEGYAVGDAIELRVWSQLRGKELRVETNLSTSTYGDSPLTGGGVVVTLDDAQPTDYALTQNYPNPFNPSTTIEFNVGVDSHVSINVYDITGRLVSTIADGYYQSGSDGYSVTWNGLDSQGRMVSAGLYIYTLQSETQTITRKMVLMK